MKMMYKPALKLNMIFLYSGIVIAQLGICTKERWFIYIFFISPLEYSLLNEISIIIMHSDSIKNNDVLN